MLPNQVSYLKGSLMDSFTLGPTPKIDFTQAVEYTPAMAKELADLQFSLNTLSKHYGIRYRIHTNYKPRAIYL
jgi:lipoprotein NlpI